MTDAVATCLLSQIKYETKVFDREEKLRQEFDALNREFPAAVRRTKVSTQAPTTPASTTSSGKWIILCRSVVPILLNLPGTCFTSH
jgi:hypothetical protein